MVIIFLLTILYIIAFYQGRSISFWPPKIGSKPVNQKINEASNINSKSIMSLNINSKPIAILEGVEGLTNGVIFIFESRHRSITIGSALDCDLHINSSMLSRTHCRLNITPANHDQETRRSFIFEIIDSGSLNGTFLNGKKISMSTILKSGDFFEIGDCGFKFLLWPVSQ